MARTREYLGSGGRLGAALLLAALGLGSWWWLSQQRVVAPEVERARQPDSYFRALEALRHDNEGAPDLRLTAAYAEHYEDEPWIHLRDFAARGLSGANPWRLSAERGRLSDDGVELFAEGNVSLVRDDEGRTPMQLQTEQLNVNTDTQFATTEAFVIITQGASRITGRGMRASLEDERLHLEHDVEAHYAK